MLKHLVVKLCDQLYFLELGLATFNYLPYSLIEPMDGSEIRIAQEYANLHNCTWRIVTDNEQWGQIFNNGTGNGNIFSIILYYTLILIILYF